MHKSNLFLHEESLKLTLEVGRKHILAYSFPNLLYRPESPAVEFICRGTYLAVVGRSVDIHQSP